MPDSEESGCMVYIDISYGGNYGKEKNNKADENWVTPEYRQEGMG